MKAAGGATEGGMRSLRGLAGLLARDCRPCPAFSAPGCRWRWQHCRNSQQAAAAGGRAAPERRRPAADRRSGSPPHEPADPAALATGMSVVWLGTSSGAPTRRRNVSGIALRTLQQTILVDCGEASNRQLVIAGIDPLSVSNIFITHMHGDHCFGLPGMLATVSQARAGTPLAQKPLRVFGPPGLQDLVASTLGYSSTRLAMPVVVAEFTVEPDGASPPAPLESLPGVAFASIGPDGGAAQASNGSGNTPQRQRRGGQSSLHEVEVQPGLTWTVPCGPGLTVQAAQLQHRVPCWGYVAREADHPPSERPDRVAAAGLPPGGALALLRQGRKPSETVPNPEGGEVALRELLRPPAPGRKVVLLGDTCNSRAIAGIAQGADLLSHEATFSSDMAAKAYKAQHSTAAMAGRFARSIQAGTLVLTHFSGRYSMTKETEEASAQDIRGLIREARAEFRAPVFTAHDFFTADVPLRQRRPARRPPPPQQQRQQPQAAQQA